jgi:hypothetical protein
MLCHEVHVIRRDFSGSHNQITFILTVLIVSYDDHSALSDVRNRVLNAVEVHYDSVTHCAPRKSC